MLTMQWNHADGAALCTWQTISTLESLFGPPSLQWHLHTVQSLTAWASSHPGAHWRGIYRLLFQIPATCSPALNHTKFNIWKDKLSTHDKGVQSLGSSPARKICQLPSEVQALKGQLWYVWVSIRPGTCWLLLCSVWTPLPKYSINISRPSAESCLPSLSSWGGECAAGELQDEC